MYFLFKFVLSIIVFYFLIVFRVGLSSGCRYSCRCFSSAPFLNSCWRWFFCFFFCGPDQVLFLARVNKGVCFISFSLFFEMLRVVTTKEVPLIEVFIVVACRPLFSLV